MNTHDLSGENACPLAAVDRRLEDAHTLWHQAESSYFDPGGFRLAAQNAVQTLRTVTFILQKHKNIIPGFVQWYGAWQVHMGAIGLMRWMVNARNKIEKQGDLEAQSFIRAEIIASYLDDGPRIEVPANLFDNPTALLRSIPEGAAKKHVMDHGTLRIVRRWVENTLPKYELLDAIAVAYGKISEVVHDAHRQMGLPVPFRVDATTKEVFHPEDLDWRMPCMVAHEEPRALLISLADGSRLHVGQKQMDVDPSKSEEIKERYGDAHRALAASYESEEAMATAYFEMVRDIFLLDGSHQQLLFFFRDKKLVKIFVTAAENPQEKYLLMRSLSNEVIRYGADAVVSVGEAWLAPASDLAPYQRPSDIENRQEILVLTLVTKTGDPVQLIAMITRDGDSVSLGETTVSRGDPAFMFAPFYKAWGRTVPEEWLKAVSNYL